MKNSSNLSSLALTLFVIFSCSCAASADEHNDFLECLATKCDDHASLFSVIYTPRSASFTHVLNSPIKNLRFETESTPKPQVIITPRHESQVPPIIYCAKEGGLQIRTRSGGHDYEGLSYVAHVPFVVIDLINLSEITVDVEDKVAWVGAGATIGSLYYKIAEKSPTLGFSAGVCPTVGVGGQFSGGGFGLLSRKYGLAADNIIDARIVNVKGRILDRKLMGEDLFWAIRGGGGASFGIVLSWKVQLVDVPERVTAFIVQRTLDQNATQLIYHWQSIAHGMDSNLHLSIFITRADFNVPDRKNTTIIVSFRGVFLGGVDSFLVLMQERFFELGLARKDCVEMRWEQSILYMSTLPIDPIQVLLNRSEPQSRYYKAKSDYVQEPIPLHGLQGLWRLLHEPEADQALIILQAYGGVMAEIPESATPYPHRSGHLYSLQYLVYWDKEDAQEGSMSWIRRLYSYMAPYVTKFPREAYINYRDLDIGMNNINGRTRYSQASKWGFKYFKNNFKRLVRVKTRVDPEDFFRNEQSIPPLHPGGPKIGG